MELGEGAWRGIYFAVRRRIIRFQATVTDRDTDSSSGPRRMFFVSHFNRPISNPAIRNRNNLSPRLP